MVDQKAIEAAKEKFGILLEKQLNRVEKLKEEGIDKWELGREKFLERAWDWKREYGGRIISQLKKLGSSCDWDRERFTMDEGCNKAVTEVFCKMHEKGWIYKGSRIINWCPVCNTSISDAEVEYEKSLQKGRKIWLNGLTLGDMGTRRRFSFDHQERVIDALIQSYAEVYEETGGQCGKFTGTSNVYFAMKKNIPCLGTMSHQCISFEEVVSGVIECNYNVMNKWSEVYDGNVGIFLYDCFGDDVFFNNLSKRMAMTFSGLRIDSGVEEEQVDKIVAKYKQLGIDPMTKQAVFSNGLDIDRAIEIHRYCQGKITDSYGVGTYLTCDVTDCKPMNIVVKLVRGRITESREWHPCVKLSCDKGKTLGDSQKCSYLLSVLGQ